MRNFILIIVFSLFIPGVCFAVPPGISQEISYEDNSGVWHKHNDYLIPNSKETKAIFSLDQERDYASSDIDADGVENNLDPSPYDWREIGYQPFGMLAFLSWDHDWNSFKYSQKNLARIVKMLKDAGVSFVRMDFLWQDIEPKKGEFDFTKYDYILDLLSRENIRILGVLSYSVSWAGKNWNAPPDNHYDFVDYVSAVVSRYKDRIKYWEIWNEPDSRTYWDPQDDMKTYTELLKLCYVAAKMIDPSCKILIGGMTVTGYYAIQNVYRNGGKDYFDVINIHPFVNPLDPTTYKTIGAICKNLDKLKYQYGDYEKKIWLTEIGCPGLRTRMKSEGWWSGVSPTERQQTKFLDYVFSDVIELPNVEKVFWAFFRDNKDHFGNDVDYFGLIRWNFSKKPSYKMYRKRFLIWDKQYKKAAK